MHSPVPFHVEGSGFIPGAGESLPALSDTVGSLGTTMALNPKEVSVTCHLDIDKHLTRYPPRTLHLAAAHMNYSHACDA